MNQKLRTARSGIVILFAILSIVCLSLSLALSAHFAAYAEGEESGVSNGLPEKDANGKDLWQVYYTANGEEVVTDWLNSNDLTYLDFDGSLTKGGEEENYYTPYRGVNVELAIKLNPDYEIDGVKLSELYNLDGVNYGLPETGGSDSSTFMSTSVTVPSKEADGEALVLTKEWVIAALCNEVENSEEYIHNRAFASASNLPELLPSRGIYIIYDFQSEGYSQIIAIRNDNGVKSYLQANDLYDIDESSSIKDYDGQDYDGNDFINYTIRRLGKGVYTLKVTAMPVGDINDSEIYYAASSASYQFEVYPQSISGEENFKELFGRVPDIHIDAEYTGDDSWLSQTDIDLSIGDVKLTQGVDYTVVASSYDVGTCDLRIVGNGNLVDEYVIERAIRINPANNSWSVLPNIISWSYGDYSKTVNKIVGLPVYPNDLNEANINDITFRIVSVDRSGVEQDCEGLTSIHYVIENNNDVIQYLVSDDVAKLLSALHAGNYRMYASVYGVNIGDVTDKVCNYRPIEEAFIDFEVRIGNNGWDSENGIPNVVAWTAGKYDPEINLISAIDRFGNDAIIIIRNGKGQMVYSNHPDHANQDYGVYGKDQTQVAKMLNKLKSGYYTLAAEVKGTGDYSGLNTLIDFEIARNGLPVWAVILIVIGALGVVALIFTILHEKGVLQMLTGKVIISMRTRANVDATIAAIRAAKVAREAEASIAAAKAREAEESTEDKKD